SAGARAMTEGYALRSIGTLYMTADYLLQQLQGEVYQTFRDLKEAERKLDEVFAGDLVSDTRQPFSEALDALMKRQKATNVSIEDTAEGLRAVADNYAVAEGISEEAIKNAAKTIYADLGGR